MTLQMESSQTVTLGSFNPKILTPDWLVWNRILPEGLETKAGIQLTSFTQGFSFRAESIEWVVDADRLIVSSRDQKVDCGEITSKILRQLPHTPIRAIGHNFHYLLGLNDIDDKYRPRLGHLQPELPDATLTQSRWVGIFEIGQTRLEVTLSEGRDKELSNPLAIMFNFHRNIDIPHYTRAESPEDRIGPAIQAAEQFKSDRENSFRHTSSLFNLTYSIGGSKP